MLHSFSWPKQKGLRQPLLSSSPSQTEQELRSFVYNKSLNFISPVSCTTPRAAAICQSMRWASAMTSDHGGLSVTDGTFKYKYFEKRASKSAFEPFKKNALLCLPCFLQRQNDTNQYIAVCYTTFQAVSDLWPWTVFGVK